MIKLTMTRKYKCWSEADEGMIWESRKATEEYF